MIDTICYGCMSDKGIADVCPYCQFDERTYEQPKYALPLGYILADRYVVGKVLGSGGFGITYLAYDKTLKVSMAIKEYLPKSLAMRDGTTISVVPHSGDTKEQFTHHMSMFIEEARAIAQFNNEPGIVSVQDVIESNCTVYIVMYYVNGITLDQYVKYAGGLLNYEKTMQIMSIVMKSLEKVHEKGLIHRDISPDNIYITKDNQVKLLDFGAARYVITDESQSLSIILKPGFAPLEQYSSKGKQGPWTDVYAVASTIYWMLTGVKPQNSMDRMIQDDLQGADKLNQDIPKHVALTLNKAMELKVEDRIQSIGELRMFLQDDSDETVLLVNSYHIPEVKEAESKIKSKKWIPLAAVLGLLLVGVPTVTMLMNGEEDYNIESSLIEAGAGEAVKGSSDVKGVSESEDQDVDNEAYQEVSAEEDNAEDLVDTGAESDEESVSSESDEALNSEVSNDSAIDRQVNEDENTGSGMDNSSAENSVESDTNNSQARGSDVVETALITVPEVNNLSESAAKARLMNAGFTVTTVFEESRDVAEGSVVGCNQSGQSLENGTNVTLVVSKGFIGKEIFFADSVVEEAVRGKIGKNTGSIYEGDVMAITALDMEGEVIDNLEGLQYLKNLEVLIAGAYSRGSYSSIQDLTPLSGLTKLYRLDLSGNNITDISALASLTNMQELSLYNNFNLTSIGAVSNMKKLTYLNLCSVDVKDLSPIRNLTKMRSLHLINVQVNNLDDLVNMSNLQTLMVFDMPLIDMNGIKGKQALKSINMAGTKMTDYSVLKTLPALVKLEIDGLPNYAPTDSHDMDDFEFLEEAVVVDDPTDYKVREADSIVTVIPGVTLIPNYQFMDFNTAIDINTVDERLKDVAYASITGEFDKTVTLSDLRNQTSNHYSHEVSTSGYNFGSSGSYYNNIYISFFDSSGKRLFIATHHFGTIEYEFLVD